MIAPGVLRQCARCGEKQPLDSFRERKGRPYNRDYWCKTCCAEYYRKRDSVRSRQPERKAKVAEWHQSEQGRIKERIHALKRRLFEREKIYAKNLIGDLVRRGKLIREPCSVCGNTNSQGHHPDYSKPLEVQWLCPTHHREEHRRMKREIRPSP